MASERIHIAEPSPPYCSGCFAGRPDKTHVDLGAAWDGPVVEPLRNVAGEPDGDTGPQIAGYAPHTIDDLILCEDCVRTAARLIGLEDAGRLRAQLAERDAAVERAQGQLAAMQGKVDALEAEREANDALVRFAPAPPRSTRGPRAKATA